MLSQTYLKYEKFRSARKTKTVSDEETSRKREALPIRAELLAAFQLI